MRLGCSVDCDGGGIEIGLSKGDGAAIVRLEHVRIWQSGKPDDEASDVLEASNDDRMFRLERTALKECEGLVTDKQDLAALRQSEH